MPLEDYTKEKNLVSRFSEEKVKKLGRKLSAAIGDDMRSRKEWIDNNKKWLKMASQVVEEKNWPWPHASNIKFPLLTTAAINFHARAYPALLGNREVVKAKINAYTKDSDLTAKGNRVAHFMSFQLLDQMEEWHEEMDRLLFILPILGLVFKKVYYDEIEKRPVSILVSPMDLILNYHAENYDKARMTHKLWMDNNDIQIMVNAGLYEDLDLPEPGKAQYSEEDTKEVRDKLQGIVDTNYDDDVTVTRELWESHCFEDLDEDGYAEPYTVTLLPTGEVFRIVARWQDSGIVKEDGNFIKVEADKYFIAYKFIPDPNSAVYALGFGHLQGPTGLAVNSIMNQLVDSGTINNLQGGFLGKGFRIKGGVHRYVPGQWKTVQTTGDDIRKNIFPIPTKEPSQVLLELMTFLIQAAKDLTSVQDIFLGKNPGQNQPFKTTEEVIEQGMKVFNGIYKRSYRSLTMEFRSIHKLNSLYPNENYYQELMGDDAYTMSGDFEMESKHILPSAEADMVDELKKKDKATKLMQLMELLGLNKEAVKRRVLEAEQFENVEELLEPNPTAPPPPEIEQKDKELAIKEQDVSRLHDREDFLAPFEALKDEATAKEKNAKADIEPKKQALEEQKTKTDEFRAVSDDVNKRDEIRAKRQSGGNTTK